MQEPAPASKACHPYPAYLRKLGLGAGLRSGRLQPSLRPCAPTGQGAGQAGSSQRPVTLFTTYLSCRHVLHRCTLPEQSSQRGSSQRGCDRHLPFTSESREYGSHCTQRAWSGATKLQTSQFAVQAMHFCCGLRTYPNKLQDKGAKQGVVHKPFGAGSPGACTRNIQEHLPAATC